MKVRINGREEDVAENIMVQQLLLQFDLKPEITIVEKNGKILTQGEYAHETVEAGDSFELIRYMGGG